MPNPAGSHTVIGVLLLITGGISALASLLLVESIPMFLRLMGAIGTVSALRVRDVSRIVIVRICLTMGMS